MLKSNRVNLVIALVMAVVLWIYVLGDVNPTTTTTIKDIPIQFLNQDAIEESGFVLIGSDSMTTDVKYVGKRSVIKKIDSSDFSVTADLEGLREGEYKLKLSVSGPDDVKIDSLSTDKITVTIDKWAQETRNIEARVINHSSDEVEPAIYEVSKEKLTISGGQSLLDKVKYLRADLEASKVGNELKAFTVKAVPVDENDEEVKGVTVEESNVSVTAVFLNKKTVPLTTIIEGRNDGGIERKIDSPKTITVKGMLKDIEGIESVVSKPINVGQIYETARLTITPILPEGVVAAANSENIYADIIVAETVSRIFEFTEENISIEELPSGLSAEISPLSFVITVTDKPEMIASLSKEDFAFAVSLKNLEKGTHNVKLQYSCLKTVSKTECNKAEVQVTISEKQD